MLNTFNEVNAVASHAAEPLQQQQQPYRPKLKIAVVDADSAALLEQHHRQSLSKSPVTPRPSSLTMVLGEGGALNSPKDNFVACNTNGGNGSMQCNNANITSTNFLRGEALLSSSTSASTSRRNSVCSDDDDSSVLVLSVNSLDAESPSLTPVPLDSQTQQQQQQQSLPAPSTATTLLPAAALPFREDLNEADQRFRVMLDKMRQRSFLLEEAAFEVAYTASQHGHRFLKMLTVEANRQNPTKVTPRVVSSLHQFINEQLLLDQAQHVTRYEDYEIFDNAAVARYQTTASLVATQKLFTTAANVSLAATTQS